MSDLLVAALGVALLASQVYWWRRLRRVSDAVATSERREQRISGRQDTHSDEESDAENGGSASPADVAAHPDGERQSRANAATLHRAAERADCPPEELPERVEALRERIRERENEIDRLRREWARSWWRARQRDPVDDEQRVVVVRLPDATTDDVKAFADCARERDDEIALVVGESEGTFAVSVGDALADAYSAADIADDVVDVAGGGAGGSATFATGGGTDPDALDEAIEQVRDRLVATLDE